MNYDALLNLFNTYKYHIVIYTTVVVMAAHLGYTMAKNDKERYLQKQKQIEQEQLEQEKNDN